MKVQRELKQQLLEIAIEAKQMGTDRDEEVKKMLQAFGLFNFDTKNVTELAKLFIKTNKKAKRITEQMNMELCIYEMKSELEIVTANTILTAGNRC
jgi:hypothetical protein